MTRQPVQATAKRPEVNSERPAIDLAAAIEGGAVE